MRTITKTFNIFKYNELAETAKERAYLNWKKSHSSFNGISRYVHSLCTFCNYMGLELTSYYFDTSAHTSRIEVKPHAEYANLTGERLYTALWTAGAFTVFDKPNSTTIGPLTGLALDWILLNPLYTFYSAMNLRGTSFEMLIGNGFEGLKASYAKEAADYSSRKAFLSICILTDREFFLDGSLYNPNGLW